MLVLIVLDSCHTRYQSWTEEMALVTQTEKLMLSLPTETTPTRLEWGAETRLCCVALSVFAPVVSIMPSASLQCLFIEKKFSQNKKIILLLCPKAQELTFLPKCKVLNNCLLSTRNSHQVLPGYLFIKCHWCLLSSFRFILLTKTKQSDKQD